jgi:hypothetical protein
MQPLKTPAAEALSSDSNRSLPAFSAGWVIRRAGLWLLFVGLGVAGSCLLYMAASHAQDDSRAPSDEPSISAKI